MFAGRLGQKHYAIIAAAYIAISLFAIPYIFAVLGMLTQVVNIVLMVILSGVVVRRLHDVGLDGTWVLLAWVPTLVGGMGIIWLAYYLSRAIWLLAIGLAVIPRSRGNNRFGAPQPKWQSLRTSILGF